MGMPATTPRWTREVVLELIARNPLQTPRYELVDGELLVTPAPSGLHQFAVRVLLELLAHYFTDHPGLGDVLVSPADVMLEEGTTVGPDVFVVPSVEARRIRREYPVRVLLLAVEVLSPGDRSGDRTRKRELYQRTIPEYWIVDTSDRVIEVWHPGAVRPVVQRDRLEWRAAGAATPFVLDVRAYFGRVYGE